MSILDFDPFDHDQQTDQPKFEHPFGSDPLTLNEFNAVLDQIASSENLDLKKLRKKYSKHAVIHNDRIVISNTPTGMTYKKLKSRLKMPPFKQFQYPVQTEGCPYSNKFSTYENDDVSDETVIRRSKILDELLAIEYPPQRSEAWFDSRNNGITASDCACALGMNSYEPQFKFIVKKIRKPEFKSNKYCYHGTKYEPIATMYYEYVNDVIVCELGLIRDPRTGITAASPDGIVSKYKLDKKHLTNKVGTMLEIKCPLTRVIKKNAEIKDGVCPIYYWCQVQQQLQACNYDNCDFAQFNIQEYQNRLEFIQDSDDENPYMSKLTGRPKGCLIQLMPIKSNPEDPDYEQQIFDSSKFLYPPRIEMTPVDCDIWIAQTLSDPNNIPNGYRFDKVIYWKLVDYHCVNITRDDEWFQEVLPELRRVWDCVVYLRNNPDKAQIILNYIDSLKLDEIAWSPEYKQIMKKHNDDIMSKVYKMCEKCDSTFIKELKKLTKANLNSDCSL